MAQYIKKSAVVAEIERRRKINKECMLGLKNLDYYQGKVDALNDTLSFINTLEVKGADAHPHWISVEDELPEENKWVLTYNGTSIYLLMLAGNGGWYDHSVAKHRNVTHWMPLPAQPAKLSNVERIGKGGEQ